MFKDRSQIYEKRYLAYMYVCMYVRVYIYIYIQGVSRLVGITAGGDFLGLFDQIFI